MSAIKKTIKQKITAKSTTITSSTITGDKFFAHTEKAITDKCKITIPPMTIFKFKNL